MYSVVGLYQVVGRLSSVVAAVTSSVTKFGVFSFGAAIDGSALSCCGVVSNYNEVGKDSASLFAHSLGTFVVCLQSSHGTSFPTTGCRSGMLGLFPPACTLATLVQNM